MLKLKDDQSLMISLRHLSHLLEGKVKLVEEFMAENYSDSSLTGDDRSFVNLVNSKIEAINIIKSKLKTLGNAGSMDEMSILLALTDLNGEYYDLVSSITLDADRLISEEEIKNKFKGICKVLLLFSFAESMKYSTDLRNNKVNDLLENDALNVWGSVFRISEWTNKNVFDSSEQILHRILDAVRLIPSNGLDELEYKFMEQARNQIGDELLGHMLHVLRSRCEPNESLQQAESQAQTVVLKTLNYLSNSKLPNFFKENIMSQ